MNALALLKQRLRRLLTSLALPLDSQQLLAQCQQRAESDRDFRNGLLKVWARTSSLEDEQDARSLANTLGDMRLVQALRARADVNDSLVYAHHVFAEIDALARRYCQSPLTSVLEIGPGTNLGALFCFVASGVNSAAAVDVQELTPVPPSFYQALREYVTCVEGFAWWRYFVTQNFPHVTFPTSIGIPTPEEILQRIDYRSPVTSTPFPFSSASFDLIYSVSALEHIPDPARVVQETHRLLRPGALAIHEIGLQHHGNADPLLFLSWSEEEYHARAQPYGNGVSLRAILDNTWSGEIFCNRLRQSDWLQLFSQAGFTLLAVEPIVLLDPSAIHPERFVEPFKSKPIADLAVLGVRLSARCDK